MDGWMDTKMRVDKQTVTYRQADRVNPRIYTKDSGPALVIVAFLENATKECALVCVVCLCLCVCVCFCTITQKEIDLEHKIGIYCSI